MTTETNEVAEVLGTVFARLIFLIGGAALLVLTLHRLDINVIDYVEAGMVAVAARLLKVGIWDD